MLFFLRLAFWFLVICLLLPGPVQDNRNLASAVRKTYEDARGFCVRNPDVCEEVRVTLTAIMVKVKGGMDLIQEWLKETEERKEEVKKGALLPKPANPAPLPKNADQPMLPVPRWGDNLSAADRVPPWRGPGQL